MALRGNIEIDTLVAQGCRPIGMPMFVTRREGNLVLELDGQPALDVLQALLSGLDTLDQELARSSLCVGVVMTPLGERYGQGDFLVRNLLGIDAARRAIGIGVTLEENSVIQFHVRDASTSAADLQAHLMEHEAEGPEDLQPRAALLFSCVGRGLGFYGEPDHDSDMLRDHLGDLPIGGFFCNGEIGPVAGRTFVHGYTSACALVRAGRAQ